MRIALVIIYDVSVLGFCFNFQFKQKNVIYQRYYFPPLRESSKDPDERSGYMMDDVSRAGRRVHV